MPWIDSSNGPDPGHPIIRAALALHGVTPGDVLAHPDWGGQMTIWYSGVAGLPEIAAQRQCIRVHLHPLGVDATFYIYENLDGRDTFWRHDVEIGDYAPPETVVSALPGRPLDEVLVIPGAEGLRIMAAENTSRGLMLRITPPA